MKRHRHYFVKLRR